MGQFFFIPAPAMQALYDVKYNELNMEELSIRLKEQTA